MRAKLLRCITSFHIWTRHRLLSCFNAEYHPAEAGYLAQHMPQCRIERSRDGRCYVAEKIKIGMRVGVFSLVNECSPARDSGRFGELDQSMPSRTRMTPHSHCRHPSQRRLLQCHVTHVRSGRASISLIRAFLVVKRQLMVVFCVFL